MINLDWGILGGILGSFQTESTTFNGWSFWQFQRAPGDWVPLDNLRK